MRPWLVLILLLLSGCVGASEPVASSEDSSEPGHEEATPQSAPSQTQAEPAATGASKPKDETAHHEGRITCAVSGGLLSLHACGVVNGVATDDFSWFHEPKATPEWVQVELVYDWQNPVEGELRVGVSGGDDLTLAKIAGGASPVILGIDFMDIVEFGMSDRFRVIVITDDDPGVVVDQDFDVYVSVFYDERPPAGWSYVNDGEA